MSTDNVEWLRQFAIEFLSFEASKIRSAADELAELRKRLDIRQDDDGGRHDEIDRLTAALHNAEFDNAELRKENELLRVHNKELNYSLHELRQENERLKESVAFFACTIKSGEPWTSQCQLQLDSIAAAKASKEKES